MSTRYTYQELKEAIANGAPMSPIIISQDNYVIDGHHRLQIAKELGWKEIPCIRINTVVLNEPVDYLKTSYPIPQKELLQGKKRSKV